MSCLEILKVFKVYGGLTQHLSNLRYDSLYVLGKQAQREKETVRKKYIFQILGGL